MKMEIWDRQTLAPLVSGKKRRIVMSRVETEKSVCSDNI